jgi:hypothetical protein
MVVGLTPHLIAPEQLPGVHSGVSAIGIARSHLSTGGNPQGGPALQTVDSALWVPKQSLPARMAETVAPVYLAQSIDCEDLLPLDEAVSLRDSVEQTDERPRVPGAHADPLARAIAASSWA